MRQRSLSEGRDQRSDLDVGRFRTLLARLSSALANPVLTENACAAQSIQDHAPILDRLRIVLDVVQRRDPFVSDQPVAWDPHLGARIGSLTTQLRDKYLARVKTELGSGKAQVLHSLLSHPIPDLLDILGKTDQENANSDMIRWLLDPREAKVVGPAALRALVKSLDKAAEWRDLISAAVQQDRMYVRREYPFFMEEADEQTQGRLDLLISGPGFKLIIENKITSDEHDNQTVLYWRWLNRQRGLRLKGAMFLTPMGFSAQNDNFKPLSYMDLLSCLLEGPAQAGIEGVEEAVLASYVKTLAASVLRQELHAIGQSGGQP